MTRVLGALVGAALVLVVVELATGAVGFGRDRLRDPCTATPAFQGGGLDGAVQRFGLSGLNGAACELGTSREELVLSFVPAAGTQTVRWDRETIDRALRRGLDRAARDAAGSGIVGDALAFVLRQAIARPVDWYLGLTGG